MRCSISSSALSLQANTSINGRHGDLDHAGLRAAAVQSLLGGSNSNLGNNNSRGAMGGAAGGPGGEAPKVFAPAATTRTAFKLGDVPSTAAAVAGGGEGLGLDKGALAGAVVEYWLDPIQDAQRPFVGCWFTLVAVRGLPQEKDMEGWIR